MKNRVQLSSKWLLIFFPLELILLMLIASLSFINVQSTITLLIFNFLFSSIIFQLRGSVIRKLGLLTIGNTLGLFWNFVFLYFSLAGASIFGKTFDAFYIIIFPVLNLLWIVPFWSLSLGLLPKLSNEKGSQSHD
jgi:hypothetical protein